MAKDAPSAFQAHAPDYDGLRRRLVPPFERFYETAVAAVGRLGPSPRRVLDLGAGTGLLSARIAGAYPEVELDLLDGSSAMLERAAQALGSRARVHLADMSDPLPEGPFDAVVSALAVHHLEHTGQQALYRRIAGSLVPGGVFVNAEQVLGPTAPLDEHYRRWHRESSHGLGATQDEWAAAEERMAFDRCADVETHLRWLRQAGFAEADCLFKDHCFAVLVGRDGSRDQPGTRTAS